MKSVKKLKYILLAAVLCVLAAAVWYSMPVKLLDIDPDSVAKITIFDGNQGRQIEVTDAAMVRRVAENLDSVTVRRRGISLGYTGYRFRVEVYTQNGDGVKPAARFIVNAADSVRKDPLFYRVEKGELDFELMQSLFS